MIQERAIKVSEIHVRLGEISEAVAGLRESVAAGGFHHKPVLAYIEAVGLAVNPAEEFGMVDRLPEPGRRRCRAALRIREGFLAGDPQAVYAAPVEDLEYEAGGVVLGRMGDRAAEFLSFRILGGDLRAVRLAGWTALPSLVPALEGRLGKEGDPGVQYEIRRSLSYLQNASPASR